MPDILFSIIIPTYNSGATISACIESILRQSYSNWEVLIIDAVSKDETIAIAQTYANKNSSIRFISEKDEGIYDAMNKGISLSKGSWLYFLGCDDRLYNETVLEDVFNKIYEIGDVEVVYGNVFSERFNGLYDGEFNSSKILKKNISHQAIFLKKSVFDKTGKFDLKYKAQSDWDHNLKWLLAKNIRSKFIDVIVAYYADGGYSSLHGDNTFYRDLRLNFIRYGRNSLSFWTKFAVLQYEFFKSIKRGDLKRLREVISSLRYLFI
jgi:glycosyltransferase involved in cell wall biosynthesis